MKKRVRSLQLHRETLRLLQPESALAVRGGDKEPPWTITQTPTFNWCTEACTLTCLGTCGC